MSGLQVVWFKSVRHTLPQYVSELLNARGTLLLVRLSTDVRLHNADAVR